MFYKNLNLSAGIDFRYYTSYNAYNYSPVMGQFVRQDTVATKNRPDVSGFLHFRIKSFTAYLRLEYLMDLVLQKTTTQLHITFIKG